MDASAVIELLLNSPAGRRVASRIVERAPFHAPHLLDLEVASAFRRQAAAGHVTAEQAALALAALGGLRLRRHAHGFLLARVWELRARLTPYDAAYIALAEALGVPLVTLDTRLARAGGHQAEVEVVG